MLNPLAFPLPLLSLAEIQAKYLIFPHCVEERDLHSSDPRFADYCNLANTGRQERNVWTVFLTSALHFQDRRAVVWLDASGRIDRDWTYGQLLARVKAVAEWLDGEGVAKGERAVLCFAPGLEYFVAFWACLSLGVVAVPVCPPDPFHPVSDVSAKLAAIMDNCQPRILLSSLEYTLAIEGRQGVQRGWERRGLAGGACAGLRRGRRAGPVRVGVPLRGSAAAGEGGLDVGVPDVHPRVQRPGPRLPAVHVGQHGAAQRGDGGPHQRA